ncbi:MAG: hypothetical protein PHI13_11675 [Methylococcales bacterium]|nr:hypothetical protein [Methylococcales bacterium]
MTLDFGDLRIAYPHFVGGVDFGVIADGGRIDNRTRGNIGIITYGGVATS